MTINHVNRSYCKFSFVFMYVGDYWCLTIISAYFRKIEQNYFSLHKTLPSYKVEPHVYHVISIKQDWNPSKFSVTVVDISRILADVVTGK